VPDEHSNLNTPATRRAPNNNSRRRGRRGGRGRGRVPRPDAPKGSAPGAEDISPASESAEVAAAPAEGIEPPPAEESENENPCGFRTPHAESPEEFASHATDAPELAAEVAPAPEPEPPRRPERARPPEPPPRRKEWVRPRDFQPAAPSAIAAAVEHATFIAEALKELHDQMDEILELVEVAERQKIADERELEDLRRVLRRVQPQRPPPPQYQRPQPRREERRLPPEPRETPPPADHPEPPPSAD
jgi:hypothetical protein